MGSKHKLEEVVIGSVTYEDEEGEYLALCPMWRDTDKELAREFLARHQTPGEMYHTYREVARLRISDPDFDFDPGKLKDFANLMHTALQHGED